MATNRTWYTEANRLNDDSTTASLSGKSLLWMIKALLTGDVSGANQGHTGARPVGSRWTVYASSDSVTAAIDSTDRWGTTFNASLMVRASAGSPRSMMVLQSPAGFPGGPYYIYLDYRDASDNAVVLAWSKNPPTAITTSSFTAPADTVVMNASPFAFHDSTATPWRAHLCVDATGSFYMLWGKSGSARLSGLLGFLNVDDPTTGVLRPVVGISEWSSDAAITSPSDGDTSNTTYIKCSAHSWNNATFHSAITNDVGLGVMRFNTGNAIDSLSTKITGVSPIDGKIFGYPVPIIFSTSPNFYQHGVMPDMYHVGKPTAQGGLDPSSGDVDHVQLGGFRLPFNAAITL
jgi:hypothetical protein